ncbi:MAG: DNA modification methylase [Candidatus Alkanophagales archaeon MCA70_species_1]|nr:DNA modification methylase [Candidatus Alkanophaga volatiphilum]
MFTSYKIYNEDCLQWLKKMEENSVHAIVTDPPYGFREFQSEELEKMEKRSGGIWRIPPKIGGYERKPLPRFTVLSREEISFIEGYMHEFARLASRVLVPGAHMFVASNQLVAHNVAKAVEDAGFEVRGIIVRIVKTLRGGFRPKNAEEEFKGCCTMPRSQWEPWLLFRKPLMGTVAENLRKYKVGALRRYPDGRPFQDIIISERTPEREREIAPHPTLKPQSFMRKIVWASLPLGEGIVLDPFMGGGSTIAAAEALGYESIGVEVRKDYYEVAKRAIPRLASLRIRWWETQATNHNILTCLQHK